jgi:hypothetical protein
VIPSLPFGTPSYFRVILSRDFDVSFFSCFPILALSNTPSILAFNSLSSFHVFTKLQYEVHPLSKDDIHSPLTATCYKSPSMEYKVLLCYIK